MKWYKKISILIAGLIIGVGAALAFILLLKLYKN